jgi:hypothetical protein
MGAGIYCDMQFTPDSALPISAMFLNLPFTFAINLETSGINGEVLYRTSVFGFK